MCLNSLRLHNALAAAFPLLGLISKLIRPLNPLMGSWRMLENDLCKNFRSSLNLMEKLSKGIVLKSIRTIHLIDKQFAIRSTYDLPSGVFGT